MLKEERTRKYKIVKIKADELDQHLSESNDFVMRELQYNEHYRRVLTQEEHLSVLTFIDRQLDGLLQARKRLIPYIKLLKLNESEQFELVKFFEMVDIIHADLRSMESAVFVDDYFNISAVIDLVTQ